MVSNTLAAAQVEIQEKQEGRALFAVRSFPAAGPIGEVLREGAKQAWLPPELTRPPDALWALNDSLGALFSADSAAGSAGGWVSPVFKIKSGAVLVLGQGGGRLSIEPANGGGERELTRLMSAEVGWQRWGALVEPGSYRVRLRGVEAGAPFSLLWPRPMSTQAYWVRAILGGISEWVLAAALLGWGLALGWLWVQPVKRDVSSESA
ncbi:MAG: hypothetical protein H7Y06_02325, partial [Opitutaceae bacterium]|nr:hypothetical protein [Opitutaceae bacterium]